MTLIAVRAAVNAGSAWVQTWVRYGSNKGFEAVFSAFYRIDNVS